MRPSRRTHPPTRSDTERTPNGGGPGRSAAAERTARVLSSAHPDSFEVSIARCYPQILVRVCCNGHGGTRGMMRVVARLHEWSSTSSSRSLEIQCAKGAKSADDLALTSSRYGTGLKQGLFRALRRLRRQALRDHWIALDGSRPSWNARSGPRLPLSVLRWRERNAMIEDIRHYITSSNIHSRLFASLTALRDRLQRRQRLRLRRLQARPTRWHFRLPGLHLPKRWRRAGQSRSDRAET